MCSMGKLKVRSFGGMVVSGFLLVRLNKLVIFGIDSFGRYYGLLFVLEISVVGMISRVFSVFVIRFRGVIII